MVEVSHVVPAEQHWEPHTLAASQQT